MSDAAATLETLRAAARNHPGWRDHAPLLARLAGVGADDLDALLPAEARSESGHRVRFRDANALPGVDYERHIDATGEVPTRPGDVHDIANALAWARWPRLKAALNGAHCRERRRGDAQPGRRGPVRDALTLFDESGAVIVSDTPALLDALARHDWPCAFQALRSAWGSSAVFIFGHAVLEKLVRPYKAITVHALLVRAADVADGRARERALRALDAGLAASLRADRLLRDTAALSPLPVAGIPGDWADEPQDAAFYSDVGVFRPPAPGRVPVTPLPWPFGPDDPGSSDV